jgi:TRAP-type C4-dicarboxylate transport system permease small subunit
LVVTILFDLVALPLLWFLKGYAQQNLQKLQTPEADLSERWILVVCDFSMGLLVLAIVAKLAVLPRLARQARSGGELPPPMPTNWMEHRAKSKIE